MDKQRVFSRFLTYMPRLLPHHHYPAHMRSVVGEVRMQCADAAPLRSMDRRAGIGSAAARAFAGDTRELQLVSRAEAAAAAAELRPFS